MYGHKIILDVDTGTGITSTDVDDGLAIALALASPEIELLGCTTCGGNCPTHLATRSTLQFLEAAGRTDIPVAAGRETPLLEDVSASYTHLERRKQRWQEYWNDAPGLPEPSTLPSSLKAHEFIIEMVNKYPGEVTIVKEGSLTNLALALLVEPNIAPKIKAVIHMGGVLGSPVWAADPYSELYTLWRHVIRMNTEFDPEATEIVARSGIPFTFVTPNVTQQVYLRLDDLERIEAGGTPYHKFLSDTSRPWIRFQMDYRKLVGARMHDPLTLAVLIDPSLCSFVPMHFDLARFRKWEYPFLYQGSQSPQVQVSVNVDVQRFEKFLLDRLASPLIR